ncbi:response regulator transcription factor [Nonomuraea jabiensis]|uniref:DNA-binding NarL/FixJ family response regulator n=1 Tax=Nonomuraea jabiensis TaxID=882448 RepID=A0A7W9GED1_9ACTN|nr:response regulator transcription factor [Nonomuraea jabiensis]MBB5782093.1 DNA-binding NarL/FixJ family response regulator [Nonomuraea jabiensis]
MRIVIADDSALLREGIAHLLTSAGHTVAATASTADELLARVAEHQPDVAVVDIRMPPTHTDEGLRAAATLRERYPRLGILLLSQWVHAGRALDLFRTGGTALGYLLKDRVTDIDDFLDAIRRIARGGCVLDPDVIAALLPAAQDRDPLHQLTDRERQVLAMMAEGRSNAAIAERLYLGRKTVETHVNAIFTKLGLEPTADDNRRVRAVLTWLQNR